VRPVGTIVREENDQRVIVQRVGLEIGLST
jgi:hypothetical protein